MLKSKNYHLSVCFIVCDDGSVRLMGGNFENEGTIEVCFGNLWGLISDSGWSDGDAQIVCNQLGYGGGSELNELCMCKFEVIVTYDLKQSRNN